MKADVNRLVAERVMEWTFTDDPHEIAAMDGRGNWDHDPRWHHKGVWHVDGERKACIECGTMPNWVEDIADAWRVVEKMREDGYQVCIEADPNSEPHEAWFCDFYRGDSNAPWKKGTKHGQARAEKLPHAASLAALRAVGVELEDTHE